MILDAILKTKSRSVLVDIINKNGMVFSNLSAYFVVLTIILCLYIVVVWPVTVNMTFLFPF